MSSRIRIIPELRNYHVASLSEMAPAATYYFLKKYDLDTSTIPSTVNQVSLKQLLGIVARSDASVLEIWEPLWMRLLHKHIAVSLVYKLSRPLKWRRREVVSYAMENNDIPLLMTGSNKTPAAVSAFFRFALGAYLRAIYSRIAYASEGAQISYFTAPGVSKIQHRLFENLPQRPTANDVAEHTALHVVLLARMEVRKGTDIIMAAWPAVERALPGAHLSAIGGGPESAQMQQWCAEAESSRSYLGEMAHADAMRVVATASVLVLPSIREGRWREQIGLPIHEGLLAGLTIVTTDETGLADWLNARGHSVVATDRLPESLSDGLLLGLQHPLAPHEVIDSLPLEEARIAANHWLNSYSKENANADE
ncbi:glycosyltransferase [Subtercola vilae]|uniref:D-inositol 3-phosphate glycosyltransferase n=1 Tax=Subtercola vilae TaxID=2056433 RepID=A0A4T2BY89_9MICO|nr:glycosyltransferase [Subtercola vilae]TIH35581.1 glycosyltransferase [Subtercola vilae]